MQSESSILIKLYYATISIIPLCWCAVVLNTDPLSLSPGCRGIIRCAKAQKVFPAPFEIIRYGKPYGKNIHPAARAAVAGTQSLCCECGLIGIW
jgi:hypothetical protein